MRFRSTLHLVCTLAFMGYLSSCGQKKADKNSKAEISYSIDNSVIKLGRQLARTHCYSCHMIEQAGIGPALGGVTQVHDKEWLAAFIKGSSAMVEKGDKKAIALFEKYKSPMPSFSHLSDSEIEAILSYIDFYSKERHIKYDPKGNSEKMQKLMVIPSEPIPKTGLLLVISDFTSIPFETENKALLRFSNMRYKPDALSEDIYINNHDGQLYHILNDEVRTVFHMKNRFPDFISNPGLAAGFGSFAFHPEFTNNKLVYLTHTESFKGKSADFEYDQKIPIEMQWVLSEFKLDQANGFKNAVSRELLRINVPKAVHGIQDINFNWTAKIGDTDYGLLYVGIGDGGATVGGHPELCHNLQSPLGTILRIDPLGNTSTNGAYAIPDTNPFVSSKNFKVWKEIYAYGFRNPHRFAWDNSDKRFLSSEISHKTFEEINWIHPGKDYGWNMRDANIKYDPKYQKELEAVPWDTPETDYQLPFAVYSHNEGRAVSGGFIYRGSISLLKGKYIFGDIVSGRIFYLDLRKKIDGLQQVYEFDLLNQQGEKITLQNLVGNRVDLRFGEDSSGELYIMTKTDGYIRKITGSKHLNN
ncbi:PQQ-dependent sugar dehydrogenase [Maribacter sp. 2308TA10-17]|uniref:PQQ-dependent sugar dehydrogenase n=1 Tax=Maribacter sp. 2308TA10-17 TaxID=3386276 RepID=UPI0039BD4278